MIKTSEPTKTYNCFAYAQGCEDIWYEPFPLDEPYPIKGIFPFWPEEIQRDYSLEAFLSLYQNFGFVVCASEKYEEGHRKVALFLDELNEPIHATFQLDANTWSSKLGPNEDVSHSFQEGLDYYKRLLNQREMEVIFLKKEI